MRDILILRDPRESKKKCSLTPLRGLDGVTFVDWKPGRRVDGEGRVLLDPGGELIGPEDAGRGLLLIDCSWRRVPALREAVDGEPLARRLPPLVTAYPRKSKTFPDPGEGLASVEALYAAAFALGGGDPELLAQYRWADEFLAANAAFFGS